MKKKFNKVSLILVSYKSSKKIENFINQIPKQIPIIVIENSKDIKIKKIFKKRKNLQVILSKNNGYGSSINLASKKIKTKYFLVSNPDIEGIKLKSFISFYNTALKLKDKFSVIGPHFINASKKGHYQTSLRKKLNKIHNVHGSVMFFNKAVFNKVGRFDKNFFMYWEETDYTKRAKLKGLFAYQLNTVKVRHEKGKSVEVKNTLEKRNLEKLYTWHFIWSKYYFFKKHYGLLLSLIYFFPIILRILFRIIIYLNNKEKHSKYVYRWKGLISSILSKKSYLRLEKIKCNL